MIGRDLLGGLGLEILEALARVRCERSRHEHERRGRREPPAERLVAGRRSDPKRDPTA